MKIHLSESLNSKDPEIDDYRIYMDAALSIDDLMNTMRLHFKMLDEDSCRFSLQLDGRLALICQQEIILDEIGIRVLKKIQG